MKRNYLTGNRGKKRLKLAHRRLDRSVSACVGEVHVGVTPWIEELKRIEAETRQNPLAGATNIEFHLPSGKVIRSERRGGKDRRQG